MLVEVAEETEVVGALVIEVVEVEVLELDSDLETGLAV